MLPASIMGAFRNPVRCRTWTVIHCGAIVAKLHRIMHPIDRAVVFLDFDGVPHPGGVPALDEDFRLVESPGLFVWRPILERLLAPHPMVGIIVSSDWRRLFDDATLIRLLDPLATRFVGVVECYRSSRSEEILAEVARRGLKGWLALDDHPSVIAAQARDPRFIACAPSTGISSVDVQRILRWRLASLPVDEV